MLDEAIGDQRWYDVIVLTHWWSLVGGVDFTGPVTLNLMALALATWDLAVLDAAPPPDSASGARILRVRMRGGAAGYLKVASAGAAQRGGAERELDFYRRVAATVPVRTPALIEAMTNEQGIALLLEDAGSSLEAGAWTERHWRAVGRDLAGLHATRLPADLRENWRRTDDLLAAIEDPDLDLIKAFWAGQPEISRLLSAREHIHGSLRGLPEVLVHGDCHTANILDGPHGVVFCDWQSTGLGRAGSDLAFLSVRATPSGTHVPADVIHEYRLRSKELGMESGPAAFTRAVALEELAILTFQWPSYAARNSEAANVCIRRRASLLADRLGPIRE